jgi:hypothetical protein
MRLIALSGLFIVCITTNALAWRCTDPDRPKCPDGVCFHDPKMQSDHCAKGIIATDTPQGPSITVMSPAAAASIRRLLSK